MKHTRRQYYVSYDHDPSGGYVASVPAIPGCVVHGKTLKQAHEHVQDAMRECLDVLREFHKQVPRETITPAAVNKFAFVRVPEYA